MELLSGLTLTGIDDRTDLAELEYMITKYEWIEFGVLLSAKPKAGNRYPNPLRIERMSQVLGRNLSVHVCGASARAILLGGGYDHLLKGIGRIQLNGHVSVEELTSAIARFPEQQIITQYSHAHDALLDLTATFEHHALLVDASGGRGVLPKSWHAPATDKPVGFAGGLGHYNLEQELPKIIKVARPGWWIDMESSLRNPSDWFSVEQAREVADIVECAL